MPLITIVFGVLLTALGVAGYYATGQVSKTALIPAYLGIVLILLGALAWAKPKLRIHAMHGAVLLALLGFLGTLDGVWKWIAKNPAGVDRARVIDKSVMCGLCLIFVVLCVRSFISARKRRRAAAASV